MTQVTVSKNRSDHKNIEIKSHANTFQSLLSGFPINKTSGTFCDCFSLLFPFCGFPTLILGRPIKGYAFSIVK